MDTEKIPRAWIGEEVRVAWGPDPEALECVLLDRVPDGIVIEHVRTVEVQNSESFYSVDETARSEKKW